MKGKKTGGRQAGTPNKLTSDLKSQIEAALISVGGQQYLEAVALDHPQVFCGLLGRLIPKDQHLTMEVAAEEPVDTYELARHMAFLLAKAAKNKKDKEARDRNQKVSDRPQNRRKQGT